MTIRPLKIHRTKITFLEAESKTQFPAQYYITDSQRKELIPFMALQTDKPIDVSRLNNGLYLIQVQTRGQIYTQKLLIQN